MESLLVAYFGPLCFPALASYPLLRGPLDNALLDD